jgi:hypothetical protein
MQTLTRAAKVTKVAAPKIAKTHRHENGVIHALSSNGQTCYTVSLGAQTSCTCPAGQSNRPCYHVQTASIRYGNTGFFSPVKKPAVASVACVGDLYNDCACPTCRK